MPGYAGNFLSRLFSLGNETMPQLPCSMLEEYISTGKPDLNLDRLELYSFQKALDASSWQQFHREWADFHNQSQFQLLNVFYNSKRSMAYQIHPHEFLKLEHNIKQLDQAEFYCVELDLVKYGAWVDKQQQKLNFIVRENEASDLQTIKLKYRPNSISLTNILDSESGFLKEYIRVCELMKLIPQSAQALELYRNWARIRMN
jgi:hypothetical protein